MPDYKLIRTWIKFKGASKAETFDYLSPEGQKRAKYCRDTADQGRKVGEAEYVYPFQIKFFEHQFEGGFPENILEIAERQALSDFVRDKSQVTAQFSNEVPGQYIDQGKVNV